MFMLSVKNKIVKSFYIFSWIGGSKIKNPFRKCFLRGFKLKKQKTNQICSNPRAYLQRFLRQYFAVLPERLTYRQEMT